MPAPSPLRETLYQVIFHVDTAAGRRFDTWLIVLILASVYSQFADSPRVAGALDGMAAVAAGLITATGIKLISALARNAMGRMACVVIGAATFVGIAWLRWPLAWVVLGVGIPACVWAWVSLQRAEGQEPLS